MVVLRCIELGIGNNFRYDGLFETLAKRLLRFLRQAFLVFIVVKDRRAILTANVAKLPIRRERIDIAPEHLEQLLVSYLFRIIGDLDYLGVSCLAGGYFLIRWIFLCAAGVTRDRRNNPIELVEGRLHAPEAAAGKGGLGRFGASSPLARGVECPSRQH